jgi:RHS repeat-associated protein
VCPLGYTSGVTPTDYQYIIPEGETGQRNESAIGLYYYNARWYDSALGRFVQADTIIPGGVQGWDRYAYVSNSPVNYSDPSGHDPACTDDGYCGSSNAEEYWAGVIADLSSSYGITFTATSGDWSPENQLAMLIGVVILAGRLNQYDATSTTDEEAFKKAYHNGMEFKWMNQTCEINGDTCYGYTENDHTIQIYASYFASVPQTDENGNEVYLEGELQYTRKRRTTPITPQLAIHELGHAFNQLAGQVPENYVNGYGGGMLLTRDNPDGFFAEPYMGQMSLYTDDSAAITRFSKTANNSLPL